MPDFSSSGLAGALRQREVAYFRGAHLCMRQKCVQCPWLPPQLELYLSGMANRDRHLVFLWHVCTFTDKFREVWIRSLLDLYSSTENIYVWYNSPRIFFYSQRRKIFSSRIPFPNLNKINIPNRNSFRFLDYLSCKYLCYPMLTFGQTNFILTDQE